jgi:hypothetical protein
MAPFSILSSGIPLRFDAVLTPRTRNWDVVCGRWLQNNSQPGEVMDTERAAEGAVLITVAAGQGSAMLARDTLARAFGICRDEAARVLAEGGEVVAQAEAQASSRALLPLFGVQALSLQAAGARYDLSLRLADPRDAAARARISAFCPEADLAALGGAAGLVLADLPAEAARATAVALQRKPGVQVTMARQTGSLYDIFAPTGFVPPPALMRYLVLLGHGAWAPVANFGGALVSGLESRLAERVVARFGGLGLFAINQAFQRFDLSVTGAGILPLREAADFLASRGVAEADVALEAGSAVTVERGLTRSLARQFLNDYSHIGLVARLTLCRGRLQNG